MRGRLDRRVALVVAGEAVQPGLREPAPGDLPVALDQQVAQLVVPRARELDHLALERAQRQLGQLARRVDEEVHARALAVVEHVMGLDLAGAEAAAEEPAHALHQRGVVAPAREREDQRRVAPVGVAAAQQPHLRGALERQQRADRAAQVLHRGGEQLVLGEGVEQRDRGLVVVRALDQPEALQALAQLAPQQRRLGRGLGVGLGGEQAEHARHAADLAVRRHAAHADVVHPLAPVHRRGGVGLVDQQQVAVERAAAHVVRQLVEADAARLGEGRLGLVGEDAEPGAGDQGDAVLAEVVLAGAEEHERPALQPGEEVHDLLDLVGLVARRAGAGELGHRGDPLEHRREVAHHRPHGREHAAHGVLELGELLVGEPPVQVEVHDRLAVRRAARVAHGPDPPAALALDGHDRVQQPRVVQPARLQHPAHRVDQERQVVGVGLQHRADRLVAVALAGRVERAHRHRVAVARAGELEQGHDLAEQRVRRDAVRAVAAEPPQVRAGEPAHGLRPFGWDLLVDELEQPVFRPAVARALLLREAHRCIIALRAARCIPTCARG